MFGENDSVILPRDTLQQLPLTSLGSHPGMLVGWDEEMFFVVFFLQNETEAERQENVSKPERTLKDSGRTWDGSEGKETWGGNHMSGWERSGLGNTFSRYVLFQTRSRKLSSLEKQGRAGVGGRQGQSEGGTAITWLHVGGKEGERG